MKVISEQWAVISGWWMARRLFILHCSLFIVIAVAYNFANPLFEGIDEIRHFRYVRYIALNKALPPVSVESSKEMQAHHPPLYYVLSALITFPIHSDADSAYTPPPNPFWGFRYYEPSLDNKNQYLHAPDERWQLSGTTLIVYLARLISLLFGLGTVMMAFRLGRLVFDDDGLALSVMAFVAFNPMILHGSSTINNNTIAAFFGSWVIADSVAIARDGVTRARAITLGIAMGFGILSIASVWALFPIIFIAYLITIFTTWHNHRTSNVALRTSHFPLRTSHFPLRTSNFQLLISNLLITLLLITLLSGWWFARNYIQSGDVMGLSEYRSAWTGEANFTRRLGEAISGLPYAWTTFWARFNYGQIVLPDVVYQIINLLCILAAAGWIRRIITSIQSRFNVIPSPKAARNLSDSPRDSSSQRTLLGMTDSQNIVSLVIIIPSLILSLSGWGALMITIPATANARLVFQIFPALGALLVLGWSSLLPRKLFPLISFLSFSSFALYSLFFYLAPAYAYPAMISALPSDVKIVSENFEGATEIIGYRISKDSVQAGDQVDVTIFWRPLAPTASPFPAFVHLVYRQRIIAAQRDTYHGLGAAPSHQWRVGVTFADVYRVHIPETAYAPETLIVRVGMWNTIENRPLITRDNDALEIGTIQLAPKSVAINFANRVTLVGYDAERRLLKPGDTLKLITRWRATNPDKEYWWYAHLVGLDRKIWKIANGPFTPQLTLDELRTETRDILLPNDLPNGQYFIEVGVTSDGQRKIGILASDGRQVGDYVDVVRVRIADSK